jgi:guanosine-3',5'-bis(diphosphate) 3'-pyrophosphohydrolase
VGDRTVAARINGEQVPLRTELKNGDVVEVVTALHVETKSGMAELRTDRPRALQDPASSEDLGPCAESQEVFGKKLLAQSLRAEGIEHLPEDKRVRATPSGRSLLRFTGNRNRSPSC